MDLKGSLKGTVLKIYPSKKFITFINDLSFQESIPQNISKFRTSKNDKIFKEDSIQYSKAPLDINNVEIKALKKIKERLIDDESSIERKTYLYAREIKTEAEEILNYNKDELFLVISDLQWLSIYLQKMREENFNNVYLHELLEGSRIEIPDNEILKRNPDLEARCVKLRAQQEAREYRKMTKSVDNVRIKYPEDTIAYQLKHLNRQLIAVGQFIISIFAGFLFGFRGIELMIGTLDFGFRLLLGVMCALIITLAEIYFLAKKLNEEATFMDTVQLGGPAKYVNEPPKLNIPNTNKTKEHQD